VSERQCSGSRAGRIEGTGRRAALEGGADEWSLYQVYFAVEIREEGLMMMTRTMVMMTTMKTDLAAMLRRGVLVAQSDRYAAGAVTAAVMNRTVSCLCHLTIKPNR